MALMVGASRDHSDHERGVDHRDHSEVAAIEIGVTGSVTGGVTGGAQALKEVALLAPLAPEVAVVEVASLAERTARHLRERAQAQQAAS